MIHREGYPFILVLLIAALFIRRRVALLAPLTVALFFRDPDRLVARASVVCPADGTVVGIDVSPEYTKISIYISLFNVHVQRIPIAGIIERTIYKPGQFNHAAGDVERNEKHIIAIRTPCQALVYCVQVAGIIARRIVCDVQDGDLVQTGQRYGIIRFGSRVDLYIPSNMQPCICIGQNVHAGLTPIVL